MSLFLNLGSKSRELSDAGLKEGLTQGLRALGQRNRVLVVPPDFTRYYSRSGELTTAAYQFYGESLRAVLPAVGTHAPMTTEQLEKMFRGVPSGLFRKHDWRRDTIHLGEVPSEFVREQSEGKLDYTWPVEVNRLVAEGDFDLILSIGQVVPHEVIGMANYNKNILVGTGGPESIHRSHYLGAVYGMERIMGRAENPVRQVLNYAACHFLQHLPIVYVLTVVAANEEGRTVARGLFIGDDIECFHKASDLALRVNFVMLDSPIRKAVVYLDPGEFRSTWLGNKAIYRTRMALADEAELIVLAPGVREFGEDATIDRLIRQFGYQGTPATLEAVKKSEELTANLSAAAHLIHGSSEGRFTITYCPGGLTRDEITSVGFQYGDLKSVMSKYNPQRMRPGYNRIEGEDVFFVPNPGLGLWAHRDRFKV
ncbi:MAG TPA: lactate racemase domain-containing protein [Candidatus Acidoferrum sp.]|nr:lactate racemase domain-containing protein [Candidatus Acidoferrum sp.]